MNTNILVTGCAGFLASHLIEELLKNTNNTIIGIDNFYSGTKSNIEYLKTLDINNKFTCLELDIRDYSQLNDIIQQYNIQNIYHLAAIVSVQESIKNPLLSSSVNIQGTLNLLEASRLNNVKRIVFSSSAAVYGNNKNLPLSETSETNPISPYGYEKLLSEYYMKIYNKLYKLETISLRYFNIYGERQSLSNDYSGVISIFEKQFRNNETPHIYGNGEQFRDFIYVKDVVEANIKAMNIPNVQNELFCIGSANKTSINDIFNIMNKKYNKNIHALYLDSRTGDIEQSLSDNRKMKDILKISNLTKITDGILKL